MYPDRVQLVADLGKSTSSVPHPNIEIHIHMNHEAHINEARTGIEFNALCFEILTLNATCNLGLGFRWGESASPEVLQSS